MKKKALIAVLSCGLSFNASANSDNKSFFNSEIFSLAKKKENAFDAPSSVYVVSSEDIRRSGVTSIPEALRLVPGIQVARISGNAWAISSRGLNHQYASKLLVLMDGVTIYTPIFSGTFWDNHDYVIEDIDRIEVIRGPGGSIWGPNAMNGIINIITKNSAETQGGYVSQVLGNNDNSITEARFGGKISDVNSYRMYAKYASRDGFTKLNDGRTNSDASQNINGSRSNNDGIISRRAGFRYDISSIKDNTISVRGDIFSNESKNYFQGLMFNGLDNTNKENNGGNLVVNWNKTYSKKSSTSLQTYLFYDRNNINVVDYKERTIDIDFQHFYNFSQQNQFIWGLGYKNMKDRIDTKSVTTGVLGNTTDPYVPLEYSPETRNIQTFSAFIQDKIGLVDDIFYLTLGSKFEINEQTGFEYQPNARLTYYPSRNQTLWAAVSRAVRIPTRGEDGVEIKVDPTTTVTRGVPTAQAEKVISYELGYRIKPTYETSADISVFYNEYSSLGTFDADLSTGPNYIPTASNTGHAKSYGLEFTGKWQVLDPWRLEVGYDFLDMDVGLSAASNENDQSVSFNNTDKLVYFQNMSPRNQFRLRSLLNIGPKIEFDNMWLYVDSLPGRTDAEAGVPSYIRWDTRLGYLATQKLDVSFGIQNILDDRHQEFGAGLFNNKIEVGRTYYVKMALQF